MQVFVNIPQTINRTMIMVRGPQDETPAEKVLNNALLWTPFIHDHQKVESGLTECNCKLLATAYCLKCDAFHCSVCKLSDCKYVSEDLL